MGISKADGKVGSSSIIRKYVFHKGQVNATLKHIIPQPLSKKKSSILKQVNPIMRNSVCHVKCKYFLQVDQRIFPPRGNRREMGIMGTGKIKEKVYNSLTYKTKANAFYRDVAWPMENIDIKWVIVVFVVKWVYIINLFTR